MASASMTPSTSLPPSLPQPTTPSKRRGGSRTPHTPSTARRESSPSMRSPPSTPSRSNTLPSTIQTPRRRKANLSHRLRGIKAKLPPELSLTSIPATLISKLRLSYTPDEWQVHLIRRILQGYDSIFCAGTGYGKSLIFEGLAVLGGTGKLVIVISPLKALEHDQAQQASAKGIQALVLNEDTTKTVNLWKDVRTTAALVYMSPEMALAESFRKLWKDTRFRGRLTAVVVDEAHCIDEWGGDDFRPLYRKLNTLRNYTGYEVPIVACTATARTSTFDLIWNTLGYGHRPFWGLDVGTDRPNLLYVTRPYTDPKIPFLDILNILPTVLNDDTTITDIPKSILYFDSEAACREAVQFLRKVLPPHLRSHVHAFSSDLSEKAKQAAWEKFEQDIYRILCATDAAGMGCNVPNIKYVISFGVPRSKSLSTVSQRWGRGGRDRKTEAVCILLVPKWAFRPSPTEAVIHHHMDRSRKSKKAEETKKDMLQRANLDVRLENFINLGSPDLPNCAHVFLRDEFSPKTGLTISHSLSDSTSGKPGFRSKSSSFEMTWTILDLHRKPPPERCCYRCNPELVVPFSMATRHDPRLTAYSHHFVNGPAPPPSRSPSVASSVSAASSFVATRKSVKVPKEEEEKLLERLCKWRDDKHRERGSPLFFSAQTILPPKQLTSFLSSAPKFLAEQNLTTRFLRKLVTWDSASESDWEDILSIISDWRETAAIVVPTTPPSQRRGRKKTRQSARPSIEQPAFMTTTPRAAQPSQQTFTSRFRVPAGPVRDENVFQTPRPPQQPPALTASASRTNVFHLPPGPSPSTSTASNNAQSFPSTPSTPQNFSDPNPYRHLLTPNILTPNMAYHSFPWTPVHVPPSLYTHYPYRPSSNLSKPDQ